MFWSLWDLVRASPLASPKSLAAPELQSWTMPAAFRNDDGAGGQKWLNEVVLNSRGLPSRVKNSACVGPTTTSPITVKVTPAALACACSSATARAGTAA